MKYNEKNPPLQCFMNQSNWMKGAIKDAKPVGILWHDTAAGNPYLKRYVQPDDDAPDRQYWLDLLGVNKYANDWNHIDHDGGLNCWIGKLADGSIATVQVGPWTTHAWGCGNGDLGSCNGYVRVDGKKQWKDEFWIQFEICDDGYKTESGTKDYFLKAYQEACEITAYLCKMFNIDPKGTVDFAGIKVPTILCHKDSYKLKLGSDHSDVLKWFKIYGYTMDKVRDDVAALIEADKPVTEVYRVRKSWSDKASQIGAYSTINTAIKECNKAGFGYSVFNSKGELIYETPRPEPEPIPDPEPDPIPTPEPDPTTPEPPIEEKPKSFWKRFFLALINALKAVFGKE